MPQSGLKSLETIFRAFPVPAVRLDPAGQVHHSGRMGGSLEPARRFSDLVGFLVGGAYLVGVGFACETALSDACGDHHIDT